MMLKESTLRRIIREEATRMLREQDYQTTSMAAMGGPEILPAGKATNQGAAAPNALAVDQLNTLAKTLRDKFKTKYPGIYVHHCIVARGSEVPASPEGVVVNLESSNFVAGFAVTGLDDKSLLSAAREISATVKLPEGAKFFGGPFFTRVQDLQGYAWELMKKQGKGAQRVAVVKTNMGVLDTLGKVTGTPHP